MADNEFKVILSLDDETDVGQKSAQSGAEKTTQALDKEASAIERLQAQMQKTQSSSSSLNTPLKQFSSGASDLSATVDQSSLKMAVFQQNVKAAVDSQYDMSGSAKEASLSLQEHANAVDDNNASLPTLRYALYDVAEMYNRVAMAGTVALTAVVGTGAAFESAFTGVERTVEAPEAALERLRANFVQLSTEIPVAFTSLSEIGTIGGQLDVSAKNIESFTKNVAMFSATTDATTENTAMSFGRIDQLANDSKGQFDNIASAVYEVGVRTVATESQILKMSQELAVAGNMAGFTANEVIGLSGALASLGVQPERARGSIERSFNFITAAVDGGGEKLDKFARIAGTSAEEFAAAWRSRPQEAFMQLLQGMNSVTAQGGNFQQMLADLGMTGVRDLDVYRRLAANVDFVGQAMGISADAWENGERHVDAYGLVADDVASKLQTLASSALGILDALNSSAGVGFIIDALKVATEGIRLFITAMNSIPGGDAILGLATGAVALGTAFAAIKGISLGVVASLAAMSTASTQLGKTNMSLRASASGVIVAYRELQAALTGATVATATTGDAAVATAGKLQVATVAARAFSLALKVAVPAMAIYAVGGAILELSGVLDSAEEKATRLGISWDGLGDAIAKDTEHFRQTGEAVKTFTVGADGAIVASDTLAGSMATATGLAAQLAAATDGTTEAIQNQTYAIGEHTIRALADQLASNDALLGAAKYMEALGFSYAQFAQSIVAGNEEQYLAAMRDRVQELEAALAEIKAQGGGTGFLPPDQDKELRALKAALETATVAGASFNAELADTAAVTEALDAIMVQMGYSTEDTAEGFNQAAISASDFADALLGGVAGPMAFEDAMYRLGESMAKNGDDFSIYSASGRANMSALSSVVSAASEAAGGDVNALAGMLAQALQALGGTGTEIGRLFASQAQDQINQMAGATANAIQVVGAAAVSSTALARQISQNAVPNVAALANNFQNLSYQAGRTAGAVSGAGSAARNTGKQAREAAKEVRTLSDYVKDLSSVMKSAFDYRWGLQQATDDVAGAVQNLKDMKADAIEAVSKATEDLADSKQKVKDVRLELAALRADLNSMKASKATLEYRIKVAKDYGSDLHVGELQAELDKLNADIAKNANDSSKAQKDLAKAQKDASTKGKELKTAQAEVKRTTTGTTQSARDQRGAMLDLVEAYQDQLIQYAATGATQEQISRKSDDLRKKFEKEATALGYSKTEVDKYAKSFQDFKKIIDTIPRDLTVKVGTNTSPASKALAEWRAKENKKAGVNIPVGVRPSGGGGGGTGTGATKKALTTAVAGLRGAAQGAASTIYIPVRPKFDQSKYTVTFGKVGSGGIVGSIYASGGFTGRGDKYDPAGIVHKGEYVFRKDQVDQSTGLPYASVLGSMMRGQSSSRTAPVAPTQSGTMVVELSPRDRKLLSDVGGAVVVMDGKIVAAATNNYNADSSRRGL